MQQSSFNKAKSKKKANNKSNTLTVKFTEGPRVVIPYFKGFSEQYRHTLAKYRVETNCCQLMIAYLTLGWYVDVIITDTTALASQHHYWHQQHIIMPTLAETKKDVNLLVRVWCMTYVDNWHDVTIIPEATSWEWWHYWLIRLCQIILIELQVVISVCALYRFLLLQVQILHTMYPCNIYAHL